MKEAIKGCLFENTPEQRAAAIEAILEVASKYNPKYDPGYVVVCDESNNSPKDVENGIVNVNLIPIPKLIQIDMVLSDKANQSEGTQVSQ